MHGRRLTDEELIEFQTFGKRAKEAGLMENEHHTGSWGVFDENNTFREVARIDVAEVGMPGYRGKKHIHLCDQPGKHLPPSTLLPGAQ